MQGRKTVDLLQAEEVGTCGQAPQLIRSPSPSPDLNLIAEVSAHMSQNLQVKRFSTKGELGCDLQATWRGGLCEVVPFSVAG